jgi:long-chain acyl-CoA synthetase
MDKDGFLFIVDRVKDMVITGGENVFSAEVENAVSTFAGVLQVAVIGIPDERWGEAVHAIIVTENGAPIDREAITQHCRNQLANYKLPRSFEFRAEPLPLSGAGKVLKRELRKPYWDGLDKGVS